MARVYSKNDIRKKIENSIDEIRGRMEAWENVKRVYKKDGKPFKVLSKNFTNCFIGNNRWNDGKVIEVSYYVNGYHRSDSVAITGVNKDGWKGTPPEESELYKLYAKVPCFFDMNVDQVEEAISLCIERDKEYIAEHERELQIIDDVLGEYIKELKTAYEKAEQKIKATNTDMCSTLEYSLSELAKNIKYIEEV